MDSLEKMTAKIFSKTPDESPSINPDFKTPLVLSFGGEGAVIHFNH